VAVFDTERCPHTSCHSSSRTVPAKSQNIQQTNTTTITDIRLLTNRSETEMFTKNIFKMFYKYFICKIVIKNIIHYKPICMICSRQESLLKYSSNSNDLVYGIHILYYLCFRHFRQFKKVDSRKEKPLNTTITTYISNLQPYNLV